MDHLMHRMAIMEMFLKNMMEQTELLLMDRENELLTENAFISRISQNCRGMWSAWNVTASGGGVGTTNGA